MSGYPITEEHKRVAVENLKRLAPDLAIKLYDAGGWSWQIRVSNEEANKSQDFDAYLVGEKFMNRPELADQSMLDEMCQYGLLTKVIVGSETQYVPSGSKL